MKPLLAFTCGDPAGVGPEVTLAALGRLSSFCRPLLVGERAVWRRAGWSPSSAPLHDTGLGLRVPPYGRPSKEGGAASFAAVAAAFRLAAQGRVGGLVTAPISKESWSLAGVPYGDHTAYFSELTGEGEMILSSPSGGLWCVLATRHLPLREAIASLTVGRVVSAAAALNAALARLGRGRADRARGRADRERGQRRPPRLVLCALNPHAGEAGLLGREEARLLAPAAAAARKAGLDLSGPVPADSAWRLHRERLFDGVVCLYHDQALIALKAAAGLEVVNWTQGPVVRTSPGHGTAFDIAGSRRADAAPTIAAGLLAARLAAAR